MTSYEDLYFIHRFHNNQIHLLLTDSRNLNETIENLRLIHKHVCLLISLDSVGLDDYKKCIKTEDFEGIEIPSIYK